MKKHLSFIAAIGVLFFLPNCQVDTEKPIDKRAKNTLLELLPASQTGVDFVQTITEEYRYNFSKDPNIFNGGGVAILDVNHDGRQDLFFTSRLQPCRLYLNRGEFKFEDISGKAGIDKFIGIKTGVTVVDINADGWDDVYVCRTFLSPIPERRNLLFINQKNETFKEEAAAYGLDDLSPTQHATFFDYDLDGDLDCYLLNHPVAYSTINTMDFLPTANQPLASARRPDDEYESDRLYRNDSGVFTDVTAEAGITNRAWGLSVNLTDLNEDGWPDLYITNDFIMPDFFYENNGDGTFTERGQDYFKQMTNHAMGCEVADLTNDGRPEIVALDMLGETWERRHRQLTTMKRKRFEQLLKKGYGNQQMRNTLQLNQGKKDGQPQFSEVGCLAGIYDTEWSWAPLAADLDLDGRKDLLITNGVRRDLNDIDFFAYTADSINRSGGIRESVFPTFEDFSNLMPSAKISNRIFRNTGHIQMEDVTKKWGLDQPSFSNGAAYADLDNDGDLDLVIHNVEDPPFIYRNHAVEREKGNWLQIECRGPKENPHGIGAKITVISEGEKQFHEMSNVRGFYSSVQPIFQVGLGEKTKVKSIQIVWPSGKSEMMTEVPANQKIVFDIKNAGANLPSQLVTNPMFEPIDIFKFTHRENTFDDFDRERLLFHKYSRLGPVLLKCDINRDQIDDVFIGGAKGQSAKIFVQSIEGKFKERPQPAFQADRKYEDTGAVFFDADQDGDQDLYVVSGGNEAPKDGVLYQDRFYENVDGKYIRRNDAIPNVTTSGKEAFAIDFDENGKMDLIVAGRTVPGEYPMRPKHYILLNKGEGDKIKFEEPPVNWNRALKNTGMIADMEFGFIGDVRDDTQHQRALVMAQEWGEIQIFEFSRAGVSQKQRAHFQNHRGFWNCVEICDLDNDGDGDIVAGNIGLNNRFHDERVSLNLYAKDFDENGSIDPIMTVRSRGKEVPVPMRDDLIAQLPHLKKKFVRNTTYAEAGFDEIISPKERQGSYSFSVNTLATTWFENTGDGWTAHPLPDEAQVAPVHDIIAEDFNLDGRTDLLLIGNDSGYDVETGPLASSPGCLLLNRGKGKFEAVPPHESGFWAEEEARTLETVTLVGGKKVILVGNNDGEVQGFALK